MTENGSFHGDDSDKVEDIPGAVKKGRGESYGNGRDANDE